MPYTPWVNEDKDILKTNFAEEFKKNEDLIKENRKKFNKVQLEQDEIDTAVDPAEENPSVLTKMKTRMIIIIIYLKTWVKK